MKLNLGPKRDGNLNQSGNHNPSIPKESPVRKLTKLISTKKIVTTQRFPSYSEGLTQQNPVQDIPQEYKIPKVTRLVTPSVIERKLFGIPMRLLIFILLVSSVIGASVYVKSLQASVKVTAVDFSTFVPNTLYGAWSSGQSFDIIGGSELVRGFTISNTATNYAMDSSVLFTATGNSTLADNDCQIQLLDSDSTSGITDTSVTSGQLSVTANYNNIAAGANKNGRWRILCKPEYAGTLAIQVQMTPTSKFTLS